MEPMNLANVSEGSDLLEKKALLKHRLEELGSVMVAYSGGVDSAYLAWAAHAVLGPERMVAVLADSPSLARSQKEDAVRFAEEERLPLLVVATHEMDHEAYTRNDAQRCFHCKDELFEVLEQERQARGLAHVIYGLNADDTSDYRPGHGAASKHSVRAPLAEAGLTKADVRALAAEAGMRVWDKPASACLSSRIEYGRKVTPEALQQVDAAEEALRRLGLVQFRVRHHGTVARVEIATEEMGEAVSTRLLKEIGQGVRAAGFQYVAIDCEGYRSGAMNEVLPFEVLLAASSNSGSTR
jgi:pyridinium-3,5-biscarboxylic acid mononucleotide sulfurtransferase